MGNAEAVPKQKLISSVETSDKVLPTDKNTAVRLCDTSSQNCTGANNEIETIDVDETMPTEKSTQSNGNDPKPTSSTSTTFSNSSSGSGQDQRQMWEEISLRYQQILHREYRMLNLPSYPVEGGNFYLYYVPVIVNSGYVPQKSDGDSECNKDTASAKGTSDEIIYIEDSDDDCVCTVKKEPCETVQAVESSYADKNIKADSKEETYPYESVQSFHHKKIKVERKEGIFPSQKVLRHVEKNLHDNPASFPIWEGTSRQVNEKFDYRNSFIQYNQSNDGREGSTSSDDDEAIRDLVQGRYRDDKNIEVTENFIRIFKGYTIEYHPLHRDNAVKQVVPFGSQQCSERDEKIQDLKKLVAKQKVELEKLKESVEGNGCAGGLSKQLTGKYLNGKVSECPIENSKCSFTGQRAREILKDCPSAQIHYFPSGERKTFLPRRRKQKSPRRVDTLSDVNTATKTSDVKMDQTDAIVNGPVNNSLAKGKRKLPPSPEIVKERLSEITKRVQCSKKSKVQRKRKKKQHLSQLPSPKLKKGQRSWCGKTQMDLSYAANLSKASLPEDISQEEFLSVFGLSRKDEKETLKV